MNTLVLHGPPDKTDIRRWAIAAGIVIAVHAGAIAGGLQWYTPPDVLGTASEPIMLDLESAPQTPDPVQDIAPGPTMQEAEPPTPEPEKPQEVVEEQVPPTPVQEKAEVVAPPEKPKPEPKPIVKPKPKPIERPKKPTEAPAPQTSASPRAAQAARMNYNGLLSAHLQRYKQYPAGAKAAGQQGVAMLSFTVSRSGQVLGASLARSSGSPALDSETMSMIRRAQPLPSFPPEMTQSSASFTVPVRFFLN